MTVVSSAANPAVKAARKLTRRHGRARAGDSFLVEGPQAVAEAGPFLSQLFVAVDVAADHDQLIRDARAAGAAVVAVTADVLAQLTTTVTPQGVVGVAAVPPRTLDSVVDDAGLLVVLHQVRDPGNAGTAVRTADAAGAAGVVFTAGSVDPHNAKAVRASVGSVFHLPVVADVPFGDVAAACRSRGVRLVAAAGTAATPHTAADLSGRVALVFGNEAHGLPAHVQNECDNSVRIPMHTTVRDGFTGVAESLNLAATVAVLTFEAARQQAAVNARMARPTPGTR